MTIAQDDRPAAADADPVMFANVIKATDLPMDAVEGFMMADNDLDDLCEAVLAQLAGPPAKAVGSAR